MEIELKNGKKVKLEVSALFMEYFDDYDGGIKKLLEDWENKRNTLTIINHFVYSVIASSVDEPIRYRDTLRLVNINDIEKIVNMVDQELPTIKNTIINQENKPKHF